MAARPTRPISSPHSALASRAAACDESRINSKLYQRVSPVPDEVAEHGWSVQDEACLYIFIGSYSRDNIRFLQGSRDRVCSIALGTVYKCLL